MDEDIEGLADQFEGAATAARVFEDALADLPGAMSGAGAAATRAGSAAQGAQSSFAAAGQGAQQAGGAMSSAAGSMSGFASAIASVGSAASSLASGPIPSATQAGQQLGQALRDALKGGADQAAQALSMLGPEGAAAGEALKGLAAVAAATIGTLLTLAGIAIDVAQRVDLMKDRFAALAGSAEGGKAVTDMVKKLSATLPFASSQISGWAQALMAAGLSGKQLENSIQAVAAATALMGEQGGAAAENLIKKLAEGGEGAKKILDSIQKGGGKSNKLLADMGLTTKDLAAAMGMTVDEFAKATLSAEQMNDAITKALKKKGAGPLEDLSNTLPNILQKAREGFMSLFSDLGPSVKPFMAAVKSLFGEFNKGSVVIKLLKPIVTSVFGTLFSWATTAVNAIHKGFLVVAIAALKVYIALKPVIDRIKEIAKSQTFITGLKVVFYGLAIAVGLVALPFLIVIAVVALFIAAFVAIVAALAYVVGAIVDFVSGAAGAIADWVSGAASAAADFVSGLVSGIVSGAGAVVDAVKGLASSALGAFTSALGISSPSKIMLEHGEENIAGAAATGIDKGGQKVDDAMARMGSGEPGGGKGKGGAGGGGKVENHYHYSGPVENYGTFREHMERFLEETDAEAPS